MKILAVFVLVVGITSCMDVDRELMDENKELRLEIEALEAENNNYLKIHYDSLNQYFSARTIGRFNLRKGTVDTFTTLIELRKVPKEISLSYKIFDSDSILKISKENEVARKLQSKISSSGLGEIQGVYQLDYPNGSSNKLLWIRCYEAK